MTITKRDSAQYMLVLRATVPYADLVAAEAAGTKLNIGHVPSGAYLKTLTTQTGAGWTGSAATALIELISSADDSTQVHSLVAAEDLTAGGRITTDVKAKAVTTVATYLKISAATFTSVTAGTPVDLYLEFFVDGRFNESLS